MATLTYWDQAVRMLFAKSFRIFNVMNLSGNFAAVLTESRSSIKREISVLTPLCGF